MAADLSTTLLQARLLLLRHETKHLGLFLNSLKRRNQSSGASVVAAGGPVVSLTTYGKRYDTVHLTIESIAAGYVLPSRLILWIDEPEAFSRPTSGLRRLIARGLELRKTPNYGPHKKYFPYLMEERVLDVPLVTADDDLLYARWWLKDLMEAHRTSPQLVNCFRAHTMCLDKQGIAPYSRWAPCTTSTPSFVHFATGVSGCMYPPQLLSDLKRSGTAFLESCPRADDVWLHVHALRAGIAVRQVRMRGMRFPFVPGTQDGGLYHENVVQSGNDAQIRKVYSERDVSLLRQAGANGCA